ncbi:MAG: transcriptional regulator, partial [Synechococcus sp. MED-G135]
CGSRSWRADRSLGGRLVCARCGAPQGSVVVRSRPRGSQQRIQISWWWWLLLGLALVVILQLL